MGGNRKSVHAFSLHPRPLPELLFTSPRYIIDKCVYLRVKSGFLDPDLKSTLKFREWYFQWFLLQWALEVEFVGYSLKRKEEKKRRRSQLFAGTCLCLWGRIHRRGSLWIWGGFESKRQIKSRGSRSAETALFRRTWLVFPFRRHQTRVS